MADGWQGRPDSTATRLSRCAGRTRVCGRRARDLRLYLRCRGPCRVSVPLAWRRARHRNAAHWTRRILRLGRVLRLKGRLMPKPIVPSLSLGATRSALALRLTAGAVVLSGAVLAGQGVAPTMPPEPDRQLAREIYKEMVEIKSGYTTGATTPVAEAAARRLKAAGFPAADIFVGGASPTKANLVVRYRGTGRQRPILLLAHTDVVEAKREDWSIDPFTFTEKDGYFYGRGTGDDKAQAAIWIANLIRYKREGFKPNRDIIVALTADEEGGGPFNGVEWLLKNKRELIDAELCLNEGGWGESLGGVPLSNDIQLSEKYV